MLEVPALVGCTISAVFDDVAKGKIVKPVAVVELELWKWEVSKIHLPNWDRMSRCQYLLEGNPDSQIFHSAREFAVKNSRPTSRQHHNSWASTLTKRFLDIQLKILKQGGWNGRPWSYVLISTILCLATKLPTKSHLLDCCFYRTLQQRVWHEACVDQIFPFHSMAHCPAAMDLGRAICCHPRH